MKKVLLVHGMTSVLEEMFEGISGWQVKSIEHDELVKELRTGNYEALFIDKLCPKSFLGEGLFPDIGERESCNGSLTAFLLALRLREVYPDLPIVIIGNVGISDNSNCRTLWGQCTAQGICYTQIEGLKYFPVEYVEEFAVWRKKVAED